MNGLEINRWKEAGLRGRLSEIEKARLQTHLAAHPGEQAAWEEDQALHGLLRQLPPAPVSSNFTAQILRRIELESRLAPASDRFHWRRFLPASWSRKLAFAAVLLGLGLAAFQHQRHAAREELARSVATFSNVAHFPTLEMFEDFEAIQRLDYVPAESDLELLLALQ